VTEAVDRSLKKLGITLTKPALAVVFIVFSILIFIFPQLVGYIVALFMLVEGILILVDYYVADGPKLYVVPPPPPKQAKTTAPAPDPEPETAVEPESEEESDAGAA
jgi:hypothetical protein